jgi:hypothetical protein
MDRKLEELSGEASRHNCDGQDHGYKSGIHCSFPAQKEGCVIFNRPKNFGAKTMARRTRQPPPTGEALSLTHVTVLDNSMEPEIRMGDILVVDNDQKTLSEGRVFWLRRGDDMLFRRAFERRTTIGDLRQTIHNVSGSSSRSPS